MLLQRWVLFKLMFCSGAAKIQVLPQLHACAQPAFDSHWPLAEAPAAVPGLGSPASSQSRLSAAFAQGRTACACTPVVTLACPALCACFACAVCSAAGEVPDVAAADGLPLPRRDAVPAHAARLVLPPAPWCAPALEFLNALVSFRPTRRSYVGTTSKRSMQQSGASPCLLHGCLTASYSSCDSACCLRQCTLALQSRLC